MPHVEARILPRGPVPLVGFSKPEPEGYVALGCLLFFLIPLAPLIPALSNEPIVPMKVLVLLLLVPFIVPLVFYAINVRALRAKQLSDLAEASVREARDLTVKVLKLAERAASRQVKLASSISAAEAALAAARDEFTQGAFSPFWDAVERAARHIAEYGRHVESVDADANAYYSSLAGREHNLPVFPVQTTDLPPIRPVLDEFAAVVRIGQTNFQFANIYEHRRTRDVIIAGFKTLGEVINSLESAVVDAITSLDSTTRLGLASVSSRLDRVAEATEHVATESTTQSEALDDLRRRRV
jgi:hypothetical protein